MNILFKKLLETFQRGSKVFLVSVLINPLCMYFNNSFVLSNSGRSGGNGGKDGVWGNAPHFTIN